MSHLLGPSPHSNLVCLEFPTYKALSMGGPPFGSPPEAYMAHLGQPGKEVPYEEGFVKTDALEGTTKDSLTRIAHWQPKRTHEVGKDENGNVRDRAMACSSSWPPHSAVLLILVVYWSIGSSRKGSNSVAWLEMNEAVSARTA